MWLDTVHDGGKKKVKNPNPSSSKRYPEVSFSSALKHEAFRAKAVEDFNKWVADQKGESKPSSPESESKDSGGGGYASMKSEEEISGLMKKHAKVFDDMLKEMSSGVAAYEKQYKKPGYYSSKEQKKTAEALVKRFSALSPFEKAIHVNGHKIGQFFQEHILKDKETHEEVMDGWRASSSSDEALQLCGALKSLGVPGSLSPDDKKDPEREKNLKKGESNKKQQDYVKEVYNFTQAFFRHHGVKTLTLFRGVRGQGTDDLDEGAEVAIQTREASSFTSDPMKTSVFGRGIEFTVPVEQVFASSITYPGIGTSREAGGIGESEVVVMGASSLKGRLITPKASKK